MIFTDWLDDNSIFYKGETWDRGKLKSNWDAPPDYIHLCEAIEDDFNFIAGMTTTIRLELQKKSQQTLVICAAPNQ